MVYRCAIASLVCAGDFYVEGVRTYGARGRGGTGDLLRSFQGEVFVVGYCGLRRFFFNGMIGVAFSPFSQGLDGEVLFRVSFFGNH